MDKKVRGAKQSNHVAAIDRLGRSGYVVGSATFNQEHVCVPASRARIHYAGLRPDEYAKRTSQTLGDVMRGFEGLANAVEENANLPINLERNYFLPRGHPEFVKLHDVLTPNKQDNMTEPPLAINGRATDARAWTMQVPVMESVTRASLITCQTMSPHHWMFWIWTILRCMKNLSRNTRNIGQSLGRNFSLG